MELYSKEELLKELKKEYSCGGECDHCPEVLDAGSCAVLRCIRRIIDNATPVDINTELSVAYLKGRRQGQSDERPTGEWIDHSEEGYVECPICEHLTNCEDNIDELHYCWNCGAKLRKGDIK